MQIFTKKMSRAIMSTSSFNQSLGSLNFLTGKKKKTQWVVLQSSIVRAGIMENFKRYMMQLLSPKSIIHIVPPPKKNKQMSEYLVNNDNNRQQTNQSNNKQTGLNMGIKCKNDLYSIFSFCIMHV